MSGGRTFRCRLMRPAEFNPGRQWWTRLVPYTWRNYPAGGPLLVAGTPVSGPLFEAADKWPLQDFALEPREVPLVQSRQTAGPAGTAQRGRASLGPFSVPAAHTLSLHRELPHHVGLGLARVEHLPRMPSSTLHRLKVAGDGSGLRARGHNAKHPQPGPPCHCVTRTSLVIA